MVELVFDVWDWVIMGATMIASLAIGVYFKFSGGKQKSNEEYLLADRNQSIFPVAVSLMTSFLSAVTLLGVASENYYYGFRFVLINLSYFVVTPIAAKLYLPVFFGLQKTSTYEYLELRFGTNLRMLASLTYTLQMMLYNGIVLYAPAIVLESVFGLNRLVSILVVGIVCTLYSTMGGMKAVLWTDLLQSILMFIAVLCIVVFACYELGSFKAIFEAAYEGGRMDFNNFSADPTERHTWWSLIIGGGFTYLSLYAVNHTQVLRLLTVSTLQRSQMCLYVAWPVLSLISITTSISGLAIYSHFTKCDPLASGTITSSDQLMPYYVVEVMRSTQGLVGLFVAGIFSASLSTISSACNALAAVTVSDYIGKWCKVKESWEAWIAKLAACVYGLVFLAIAFLAENLGGILQAALTIFGAVGGPLLGVFTLGMFTTFAREGAVSISLITGMALGLWMNFGGPRPGAEKLPLSLEGCLNNVTMVQSEPKDPSQYLYLYRVSYMWTSPIGFLWVIIIGGLLSLIWRQKHPWEKQGLSHPDPALFTPPLAKRLRQRFEKNKEIEVKLETRY